jgi:hypothetical protein
MDIVMKNLNKNKKGYTNFTNTTNKQVTQNASPE